MSWDDEGNVPGDGSDEIPPLRLPPNKVLVARIRGEPSPALRQPRVTILSANDSGVLVTRTENGMPLWRDPGPGPWTERDANSRPLPEDPGGECGAMFDGWHLIEWFNCTRYNHDRGQLTGTAEYYGSFDATVNEQYGFVEHVDVQVDTAQQHRLIEVQAWWLVDDTPELLSPVFLDVYRFVT
jgi:hypothetical protein